MSWVSRLGCKGGSFLLPEDLSPNSLRAQPAREPYADHLKLVLTWGLLISMSTTRKLPKELRLSTQVAVYYKIP